MKKKTQELWSIVWVIGGKKIEKKWGSKVSKQKSKAKIHGPYVSCKNK